jgi:hypothetical protein
MFCVASKLRQMGRAPAISSVFYPGRRSHWARFVVGRVLSNERARDTRKATQMGGRGSLNAFQLSWTGLADAKARRLARSVRKKSVFLSMPVGSSNLVGSKQAIHPIGVDKPYFIDAAFLGGKYPARC